MRAYLEFTVDIKPFQAVQLLLEERKLKSDLVFEDYKITPIDEKEISILVFEKAFSRSGSTTVTVDNFSSVTIVKCITAGNGQGWGAGKGFIKPVRKKLESHIIGISQES